MDFELKNFTINGYVITGHTLFNHPFLKYKGCGYFRLWDILTEIPLLIDIENRKELASIINFIAKGIEYKVITNIELFKHEYLSKIANEKKVYNSMSRSCELGEFDVSLINPPLLKEGKLIFYVENSRNKVPYRVSCDLSQRLATRYELLTYAYR